MQEIPRDEGSIPGLGGSPGEGNGNPLQYSCLENPMDRGAWRAAVHGVTKESDMTEQLNNIIGPSVKCCFPETLSVYSSTSEGSLKSSSRAPEQVLFYRNVCLS